MSARENCDPPCWPSPARLRSPRASKLSSPDVFRSCGGAVARPVGGYRTAQVSAANVGDIAKGLMLDSGTTTPLVRRLETRGLPQRTRSSRDERVVTVSLTTDGRALEAEMTDLTTEAATATGLEATEAQATIAALQSSNRNLADVLAQPREAPPGKCPARRSFAGTA
ncbi:MarR family transcriptional regulator [Rathayibacter sp. AY1D1]|uniref:MarR family transcriptional regulator n=1 Tax=Rathayibacter sp. AY1D1 TaxID=2080542 RepID=UPI0028006E0D|nr:MarR family transcriptional regulator [Rathayibacter sp. AY1D1]